MIQHTDERLRHRRSYNRGALLRQALGFLTVALVVFAFSCGDDDVGEFGDPVVSQLPENTFGVLDGSEDGQIKYPVLELWDVPECRCDQLITNTPHNTRVRVWAKKAECFQQQYEVEILEGPKAGERGWVFTKFVRFDDGAEP